jgi:protein-S-isoprenylcysteine O-methyltransferase Ste14
VLHTVLFAIAAWMFFSRRIPYEEESLMQLFPHEYPDYKRQTFTGIPFLFTSNS